jgi:hypothetical protein
MKEVFGPAFILAYRAICWSDRWVLFGWWEGQGVVWST